MAGGDPSLKAVGQPGDVMVRGASGWGPRALSSLLRVVNVVFVDSLFRVANVADLTKKFALSLGAMTTGKTLTLDAGAQTADRTLSVPALAGAANLVVREAAMTDNAVVRADSTLGKIQNSAVIIDDSNNVTGVVGLSATSLTASGLTSGRVPVAGTAGLLGDSASLTASATAFNFGDGVTAGARSLVINGVAASVKDFNYQVGSLSRVILRVAGAESVSDAGSDFSMLMRTDAGGAIDTCLTIIRATGGLMTIARPLSITNTTDSTTAVTGAEIIAGGLGVSKTLISAKGQGWGVTSTATHNGATTLVQGSTIIQTFTGTTAGEIPTMPAANLWGAGIAVMYVINNQSNQTITPTRAGSDTFQGGGTTDPILAGATQWYASNGVSVWLKL